jgi:NAD(P)-dependent dehydrogenase (short-subunit alcohol dehydrogenase family)
LNAALILAQQMFKQSDDIKANIINMLDYAVINPPQNFLSYGITKSALFSLTKNLALSLAPNIRVNSIAPGPVIANHRQSAERFNESFCASPLGFSASLEEIANTVKYILNTSSLTGQTIILDGGKHLSNSYRYF